MQFFSFGGNPGTYLELQKSRKIFVDLHDVALLRFEDEVIRMLKESGEILDLGGRVVGELARHLAHLHAFHVVMYI